MLLFCSYPLPPACQLPSQLLATKWGKRKNGGKWGNMGAGRSLTEKQKGVPVPVFPKKPAGTSCAQPWLVAVGGWWLAAVGGWQLATGGWWRLVVVGGGWWLVIGGWRRLALVGSWRLVAAGDWRRLVVGGWWRLVVGGWWRLAVDGSWQLAVGGPLGRSLRAVKIWFLKDRPAWGEMGGSRGKWGEMG